MKNKIKSDLNLIINNYKFELNTKENRTILLEKIRLFFFEYLAINKPIVIDYQVIDTTTLVELNTNSFSYKMKTGEKLLNVDRFIDLYLL